MFAISLDSEDTTFFLIMTLLNHIFLPIILAALTILFYDWTLLLLIRVNGSDPLLHQVSPALDLHYFKPFVLYKRTRLKVVFMSLSKGNHQLLMWLGAGLFLYLDNFFVYIN